MDIRTPDEIEAHLASLAPTLSEPRPRECVLCYVDRILAAFGCDTTLRWARRWRDRCRPRSTGLERRLEARGGFCHCEIFMNGWTLRDDLWAQHEEGEWVPPEERPACAGIASRSSQPCALWRPWRGARG
jgi:hypothetical protein